MKALFIIAPKDFRDEELFEPKKVLEDAGIECDVASTKTGEITGNHGKKSTATLTLTDIHVEHYDAIILVGGNGAKVYFNDTVVHTIFRDADAAGKVIAAICVSPTTLANADLLEGKKATVFKDPVLIDNLKTKGAKYQGEGVTVDGKIVTASGPDQATKFGKAILELLQKS